jgi:non-ribosomal peptide synthetase-like protein
MRTSRDRTFPRRPALAPRPILRRPDGETAKPVAAAPLPPPVPAAVLTREGADNTPRWREGERLDHLFAACAARFGSADAVVTDDDVFTYEELEGRANQVARYLIEQGITAGDRIGLLFDKTIETYAALLAVLKVNAAYVPLDPAFPVERLRFIAADAGLKAIVSMAAFDEALRALDVRRVYLDSAARAVDAKPRTPLRPGEAPDPVDRACYILYTSGTTGNPKGVLVEHPSICNFVRVAAELYGFAPGDRVYQGMTIAFDFSVEEIWVPLMAGATLVPGRSGSVLVGDELADFLDSRKVTCLCCCPTLLATIERELPRIRILLVGGEACPRNLVTRWHRPGRTILNSYGPTETTVTATLTELTPDKPVTIGRPLPSYAIVILDPADERALARGERGEIGIAGIGLAAGYLNREELTGKKFIRDFLDLPDNPSRRIYRTGDLGRINEDGEIEYHGRIDTQVKIRGHRIELAEIESVMLELPQIAQAAVATFEPEPGLVELVGYYALKQGRSGLAQSDILKALRGRLPAYMVPAFLEELPFIPMLISNKADHKKLPRPKGQRVQSGKAMVAAATASEAVLTRALAEVLKLEQMSVEDHFFNDLGANSLLMARFCARARQNPGMATLSMQDIYQHPTVAQLARHLAQAANETVIPAALEPFNTPSAFAYYGCGALQLLAVAGYALASLWFVARGFEWTYAASGGPVSFYLRCAAFAVAAFLAFSAFPIAAKWLLVGRWKEEKFPIWSLRYFRFWVVKTLVRTAPPAAFVGSPLFNLYLRLLGAKIGRGVVIESRIVPVATDLFSVGADTVLRKGSMLPGYRAQANFIQTGRIDIGARAFVGEGSVLDTNTAMGDDTQLGHASSLQSGQRVPDGQHWHGSPALATAADYCPLASTGGSRLRRGLYGAARLIVPLLVVGPFAMIAGELWYDVFVDATGALPALAAPTPALIGLLALAAAALLLGMLALDLAGVYLVPRLCRPFLQAGKTYPLFGFHHGLQTLVSTASNSPFCNLLFGDSSAIVHYMRLIGWDLGVVEQTGSNFGTNQQHDNPLLCEIGSGTMVSDGLSMINIDMSASSFRLSRTRIGERNYLGNDIHYPPQGRTGANCLLGTKVMVPIDGPVRENAGLLGSPCFEIPRMVERDQKVNAALSADERRARLRRKNVYSLATALLFLAARWGFLFVTLLVSHLALIAYAGHGVAALFAASAVLSVAAIAYFALIERASLGFRRLTPTMASIYDAYFWRHERHWKLSDSPIVPLFAGTPLKPLISRLIGMKVGRRVYDGGCSVTDRSLTEVGDYANLNEGSVLQAHSLEEGVFKSDYVRVGKGCTLGCGAFIHYGVTMGDRAVVDADSFVMKGEILDPHSRWRGNPARLVRAGAPASGSVVRDVMEAAATAPEDARDAFVPRVAAE